MPAGRVSSAKVFLFVRLSIAKSRGVSLLHWDFFHLAPAQGCQASMQMVCYSSPEAVQLKAYILHASLQPVEFASPWKC